MQKSVTQLVAQKSRPPLHVTFSVDSERESLKLSMQKEFRVDDDSRLSVSARVDQLMPKLCINNLKELFEKNRVEVSHLKRRILAKLINQPYNKRMQMMEVNGNFDFMICFSQLSPEKSDADGN